MTTVQKQRLVGFRASLSQRGVLLSLQGTEITFDALVQRLEPDTAEFSLSNETRDTSNIYILRDTDGVGQVNIGSVFIDSASSTTHRVAKIEDHPTNIAVVFYCETAAAD